MPALGGEAVHWDMYVWAMRCCILRSLWCSTNASTLGKSMEQWWAMGPGALVRLVLVRFTASQGKSRWLSRPEVRTLRMQERLPTLLLLFLRLGVVVNENGQESVFQNMF